MKSQPSYSIQRAVKVLSSLSDIQFDSSTFEFLDDEKCWIFEIAVFVSAESEYIPQQTRWIIFVDLEYPRGLIRIYPASIGGICHTFPHQDRNVIDFKKHTKRRLGKPCVESPIQRIGRIAGGPDPKNDAELRLLWHVQRLIAWLEAAASDELMASEEPFELPQYTFNGSCFVPRIVHDEGMDTFDVWQGLIGQYGVVHYAEMPDIPKILVATQFFHKGTNVRTDRRKIPKTAKFRKGFWWLWPEPVVMRPWHAPGTWGELRCVGRSQGVDVDHFLHQVAKTEFSKKEDIFLLLGYPIPVHWRGAPAEIHWQSLSFPKIPIPKGFRDNEHGRQQSSRLNVFGDGKDLTYQKTENWHPERLQARGKMGEPLPKQRVLVIGGGALGSSVAELLVRGGSTELTIIDYDILEVGNLVRHTLTTDALGQNKADALAKRLQKASPMAKISGLAIALPHSETRVQELLALYDVVIDCTGDNDVLEAIGAAWWESPKLLMSASMGFAAKRLFIYAKYGCSFPYDSFSESIAPWLEKEKKEWSHAGELLEGVGCWSPLFPARCDDVWMAAVATVKLLERFVGKRILMGTLYVLEQETENGIGYRWLEPCVLEK